MKKNIVFAVSAVVILAVGFFAGMEYQSYRVRSALSNAFSGINNTTNTDVTVGKSGQKTAMETAKEEDMKLISKSMGDEIELATIKVKVMGSDEQNTISSSYSQPKVVKEGATFVVVKAEVTNITNSSFSLPADFLLIDDKGREFSTYRDTIGNIDDYLDYRELSPSVKETGVYVYEVPKDATSYNISFAKAGSKDVYQVKLK
jgi:hypothetical protein